MTINDELKRILALVILATVAGCTPDPEELMSRASSSLENGDARSAMLDLKSLLQQEPDNAKARALLGEAYVLLGDVGAADIELAKAKQLGAPSDLTLLPTCRVLLGQAKYEEVLEQCAPGTAAAGRSNDLQVLNGNALIGLERAVEAKAAFKAALAKAPDNLDALLGLAAATQLADGPEAAKAVLESASDSIQTQTRYWMARAGLEAASGNFPAAVADYKVAVDKAKGPPDSPERIMSLGGLAEAQMRQGDVASADETSGRLMKAAPTSPMVKQLRAQIAAAGGKTDEARTLLEEVVASQPQNFQARTLLAIVNLQQGNLDQAQMHLQQVVANQPQNARAQRLLAEVGARLDSPDKTLASVEAALDETQNDPEMLAMAGRLSLASGDREQAMTYLAAASKSAGQSDAQAQIDIASGFVMAGEFDRALEVLEAMPAEGATGRQRDALMLTALVRKGDQAKVLQEAKGVLQRMPKDADIRNLVGGVYAAIGKFDLAREQFNEAAKLAPATAAPYINLGRLDLAQRNTDSADTNFKRALEKDPRNLAATLALAVTANLRKDSKAAEKHLQKARDDHPDAVEPHLGLAQLYLQDNQPSKAKEVIEAAAKANPKSGAMANARGLVLQATGDVPGAIASFEEALRLEPKGSNFAQNLARAKLANRDVDGALKTLDQALAEQSSSASTLVMAANVALQAGRTEKAAGYVERLRKIAPDAPQVLGLEGDLALVQKRHKDALGFYRRANAVAPNSATVLREYRAAELAGEAQPEKVLADWVSKNPGDANATSVLAELRRTQGNPQAAIALYEAALAKVPDNVVVLNNLAVLYDLQGNSAKAEEYAARAYKADPKSAAIADTYGWILFRQGKVDRAAPLIRDALKTLPDNPEVQYHQAAVLARTGDKAGATVLLKKALAGTLPVDQKAEAQKLMQQLK